MNIAVELKKTLEDVIRAHSPVSVDDIRKSTIDMLKVRIEAYKDMLIEMRQAELSKAEKCSTCKGSGKTKSFPLSDPPHGGICPACSGKGTPNGSSSAGDHYSIKKDDMGSDMVMSETEEKRKAATKPSVFGDRKEDKKYLDSQKQVKKEEFIDRNNEAIPGKRLKEAHNPAGVLPGDKKSKVIESDGSGEVTKGKLGKSIFPENKNGEDPLTLGKASVPMAKPSGGGTGLIPKAPSMSKPAPAIPSVPKPITSPKPPSAPTMKAEKEPEVHKFVPSETGHPTRLPTCKKCGGSAADRNHSQFMRDYENKFGKPGNIGSVGGTHYSDGTKKPVKKDETMLSSTKQTGAATQLEPKNTVTDHTAGKAGAPAVTSSQVGTPGKAGPVAPLFESGRTHGTTDVFEPKKGTLASIIKGASLAKAALSPEMKKGEKQEFCSECSNKVKAGTNMCTPCAKESEKRDEKYRNANPEGADESNTMHINKATLPPNKMMATQANHDAHKDFLAQPKAIIPQGKTIKRPTTDYTDFQAPGKFSNSIPKVPGK